MKVIGRDDEILKLQSKLKSDKAELIAIVGRRRIGKTFLIKQVYQRNICFQFTGLWQGTKEEHLTVFSKKLQEYSKKEQLYEPRLNWFEALDDLKHYLKSLRTQKKKVIFFDEFPWISGQGSRFLTAFTHFWNDWASNQKDLIIVICGSSASWMITKILKNKGGLHNRVTSTIHLNPFTLFETEQMLLTKNPAFEKNEVLKLYMILGGVPFYLDLIENGESAVQAVDRLCFIKKGALVNEYGILFSSLFDEPENHFLAAQILAQHHNGLTRNELAKKMKLKSGGGLTKLIDELSESGFIIQYIPFGKQKKDAKIKLVDSFTLFYHKYMANHIKGNYRTWEKIAAASSWQSWSGLAFENVCMQHVPQIKKALKIEGIETAISSWHHKGTTELKGAQIDLLINRADGIINICEMKYSQEDFFITTKYAQELRHKILAFKYFTKTKKSIFPTIVTNIGLIKNANSFGFITNTITVKELFTK